MCIFCEPKSFLHILQAAGTKIVNGSILAVLLVSNFAGVTRVSAAQEHSRQQGNALEFSETENDPHPGDSPFNTGLFQTSCQTSGDLVIASGETCQLPAGAYTLNSVVVQDGGTLILVGNSSSNQGITVNANNVTIESGGKITADGTGYVDGGPGGGSSVNFTSGGGGGGGYGGLGQNSGQALGGSTYGSSSNPMDLGSAGGDRVKTFTRDQGGAGGGGIHFLVSNSLQVDGEISADGANGVAGGGSGGSILIETTTLTGNGSIHANGGDGQYGGSGGGGRIAVYAENSNHTITFSSSGGPGWETAGEGTAFLNELDPEASTVDVAPAQATADGTSTAIVTVTVRDIGIGSPPMPNVPVEIALESGSGIEINGQTVIINEYVSIGNTDENGSVTAELTTTVTGIRTIKARSNQDNLHQHATANFVSWYVNEFNSTLETDTNEQYDDGVTPATVTVTAVDNYGDPLPEATVEIFTTGSAVVIPINNVTDGQGIAVFEITNEATETTTVTAKVNGILLDGNLQIQYHCRIDGNLTVFSGDTCSLSAGTYTFDSIVIQSNGTFVIEGDTILNQGVTLIANNITIEGGGKISADSTGYANGGLGSGDTINYYDGGGGGGGYGGVGQTSGQALGGSTYGSLSNPTDLGSAGGDRTHPVGATDQGGAGGGAIRLIVGNSLQVDGEISADGANSVAGGGSGGSILIETMTLAGNGSIHVNGGDGQYGGSGGGGRIAVYAENSNHTITFSASGGPGWESGGEGTIYLNQVDEENSTVMIAPSQVTADGTSTATVTVTVLNVNGYPIPDKPVEIAVSSGFGLNINTQTVGTNEFVAIGNTDENGQVTATLTTTKSGTRYIKAKADQESIEQNGSVEFIPGPVSTTLSRIDTGTAPIPADGSTPGNITVTIFDANNNPISDITVALQSTGSAVITPSSVTTNSLGMAFVQIFNSVPESVIVSAAVDGAGLTDTAELVFKGADLSVSMTAPSEAPGGRETHYFYKVGVSADYLPTPDTTLVVTLPAGITYVDDTSTAAVVQNGQTLSWDFDTLNPGETLSFTLIGEISSSLPVGASLSTTAVVGTSITEETLINNSATVITTLISGFSFTGSVSPINQTLGIGATGNYEIIIENTGLLADTYDISITGIDPQQYTLSPAETTLTPGETGKVALSVYANSCEEGGSHPFVATITSRSENMSLPLAATTVFQSEPVLSSLRPGNESVIGSRDVTVSWNTDTVATGVLTVYPLGEPQEAQGYQTPAGTMHLVVVPGLSRQTTYEWYVTAVSPCGTVTSATRQFTVGNGVVFQKHQQSFTINRDYDQTAQIWVTNQDNRTHEVFLEIQETYDDLTVNFRGSGSIDGSITLLPGESRAVELAVFAQDAALHDYTLSAVLTSSDGEDTINDFATINIHVLFDVEYTFEVVSSNPVLNIKTYRITNLGQPITDLYVRAVGRGTDLPAPVYISPQIVHARLGTGESIEFNILPLYSNDDLADASGELSPLKVLASLEEADIFDGSFDLISEVAGVVQRHQAQQTCDGGRSVYPVMLSNVMMPFSFRSWYCPNRENIYMGLCMPPFVRSDNITGANLRLGIDPTAKPEPYNFSLNLNGNSVATINNQILDGEYMFPVNPAHIKTGFGPCTKNVIHIHADFPNYAHYKVWANGTLWLALDSATVYICASSQAEANQLAQEMYGFVELPEYFDINIQKPATSGTVQPEEDGSINLQAFVSDSASTYTNFYQVEAEVEYLDVLLTPKENILLYDDGASVHGDSASDDRYFNALWQPKYGGQVHMTVTATGPDGRVATDEMTFMIEALPDLAINKVFIEEVSLLNTNARVRAEITNLGFTVSGPVNVDFIYYATDENGNKVGDPIHTSHLQILTGQPGQPVILTRGSSVEIEDTEFTPNALALYFVEVIVDP